MDSIWQNEMIHYKRKRLINAIPPYWGGWNANPNWDFRFDYPDIPVKRKDSLDAVKKSNIILIRKIDSIKASRK